MGKLMLFLILAMTIVGCSQKKEEKSKSTTQLIGKYVYIDRRNVLHTKNGCKAVYKDNNMQQVNPIEPVCISFENLNSVCSQCVTEQMIDSLRNLFKTYRQTYRNVGNLYEDLLSRNYDLPSELQFRKDMREHAFARSVYQVLIDEKANVGTYEEFAEWIGLSMPAKRKSKTQL